MALHLASNGCYGVMIYNNKDYPDSFIDDELRKYGKVHEVQKGGKNLIFIYYKHYEEARSCLDTLSSNPDFNAKPAKPRETSRSNVSLGARQRAKSVVESGERYRQRSDPAYERKQFNDKTLESDSSKSEELHPLKERAVSLTAINLDKVENHTTCEKQDNSETIVEMTNKSKESEVEDTGKYKFSHRQRSKSLGRLNVEDESKRAELIKKIIKCESEYGGSLDSLFEKHVDPVDKCKENNKINGKTPQSQQLLRAKYFNRNLPNENFERPHYFSQRRENLWLSPKPNFQVRNDRNPLMKLNPEPFLLPAITIYEYYIIASQKHKSSQAVVISGLPLYITEEYLIDLCAKFSRVLRIRLINSQKIEDCRAYVYVKSIRDAINLKRNIDRKILFCHIIEVDILSDILKALPFIKY